MGEDKNDVVYITDKIERDRNSNGRPSLILTGPLIDSGRFADMESSNLVLQYR